MRTAALSIIFFTIFAFTLLNFASANLEQNTSNNEVSYAPTTLQPYNTEEETGRDDDDDKDKEMMMSGNGKEKENGLEKMYMIFMMCKTLISTLLMFVSPIIQIKGFGLSLIGTILNIARFVMSLKNSKSNGGNASSGGSSPYAGLLSAMNFYGDGWHGEDRVGMAYSPSFRPNYISHYPNYIHKYHIKP